MSRVAKAPVALASGVEMKLEDSVLTVKGSKGELKASVHGCVQMSVEEGVVTFRPQDDSIKEQWAHCGTARAIAANCVKGVTEGFEKRLELRGVGYRAAAQGQTLNLNLGFSHPVAYAIPAGITVETPTPTEVVVKGADKQVVGQVAANIRGYRPPEPYKGKGVRYVGEHVVMKEAKKK
ncbi:MAG: 50S ribosomal protein L6 [Gammaproteobacteria bacterium]|nr:50S ribosomal protein L6 [Gammaproteobacteria bacterium]